MNILIKIKIDNTLRTLLIRTGVSILIMGITPFSSNAADTRLEEDDFKETSELNETIPNKAKKEKNTTTDCSITTDEKTPRSIIPSHKITTKHLLAERTVLGEASLRAERVKTTAPASVIINNYRMALEEYLSLVNTLLPEPYLLRQLQPHPTSFLKQTESAGGSFSPAGFTTSFQKENPPFKSQYKNQHAENRKNTRSDRYLEHEVRIKSQARSEVFICQV